MLGEIIPETRMEKRMRPKFSLHSYRPFKMCACPTGTLSPCIPRQSSGSAPLSCRKHPLCVPGHPFLLSVRPTALPWLLEGQVHVPVLALVCLST